MKYRVDGQEKSVNLTPSVIFFYVSIGTEHVALPIDEARILIFEKSRSF